jgi:DNA-binding transcriptional MocR family regulator
MSTISFARGIPAAECLPVAELADCAKAALERDGRVALSYGSTLGYEPLREWIAERHGVEPERVVVTNGSLQAFHFVLDSLGGDAGVIVERPTYDRPRGILAERLGSFEEVPLDDDGLDVGRLAASLGAGSTPDLLYTIPTFQNPSGVTLSEERRVRLAELARRRVLPVLEDDPYGLVRFEGDSLPTVFELAGGEGVTYSSSFSKTIAPGVRVGYLIVPARAAPELERRAAATYITPALLAQATVYEFLRRGLFEPNLERVRGLLRDRRDTMLAALEEELDGCARWNRPQGGYFLWLELLEEIDAMALADRAGAGVTFVPGPDFGGAPNTARLAFSFASPAEIEEGVRRLAVAVTATPAAVERSAR